MNTLEAHLYKNIVKNYDTPCYVYHRNIIKQNFLKFKKAFSHIHYAVKANSNLAILQCLSKLGSGFDIVSGGELMRVLKAGGKPSKIVFSGVGKKDEEIKLALENNIACFNVESRFEIHQLQRIAKSINRKANIALRVNPDISVKTHPYITTGLKHNKFGIGWKQIIPYYLEAKSCSHLKIKGIACHLGSQIFSQRPYISAMNKLLYLKKILEKNHIPIVHLDIGGGFGIDSHKTFDIQKLSDKLKKIKALSHVDVWVEPGRAIIANAGILLTRVISVKLSDKKFVITDCAMNDLIRPALYSAYHEIQSLQYANDKTLKNKQFVCDIVGPVCETSDFLGKDRKIFTQENDILLINMAGAYGFSMSSNYNSRPRCAEVLLDTKKKKSYLIRERESIEDLMAKEKCLK